jgi:hypothetical protein
MYENLTTEQIMELIKRRRKQIIVFSYMYYCLDESTITDYEYDKRARELILLQNEYPWIASKCIYHDIFKDYDGCSGFNIRVNEKWVEDVAVSLLNSKRKGV